MTESLIERVAKVLDDLQLVGDLNFQTTDARMEQRRRQARAAVAAMREPTKEMVNAADKQSYGIGGEGDAHLDVWHWLIDAALAEPPKPE